MEPVLMLCARSVAEKARKRTEARQARANAGSRRVVFMGSLGTGQAKEGERSWGLGQANEITAARALKEIGQGALSLTRRSGFSYTLTRPIKDNPPYLPIRRTMFSTS